MRGGGGRFGAVQLRAGADLARRRRPRVPNVPLGRENLLKSLPRTPCPGAPDTPPPTIATNATARVVAGIALHNAMRLAAGDPGVFDCETIVDLRHDADPPAAARPFGGVHFAPPALGVGASRGPRGRLHAAGSLPPAGERLGAAAEDKGDSPHLPKRPGGCFAQTGTGFRLEAFNHPVWTAATCSNCGDTERAAGTWWASPPACRRCGSAARWQWGSDRAALSCRRPSSSGPSTAPWPSWACPPRRDADRPGRQGAPSTNRSPLNHEMKGPKP